MIQIRTYFKDRGLAGTMLISTEGLYGLTVSTDRLIILYQEDIWGYSHKYPIDRVEPYVSYSLKIREVCCSQQFSQ